MGSSSSGNHGGKHCTDDLRALDVRRLAHDGLLKPGAAFSWSWTRNGATLATINLQAGADSVLLDYRHKPNGGDWQDKRYAVRLVRTACHLGGQRVWWQCPGVDCGRRVALLYLGSSGIFACRHCNQLAYRSTRDSESDRAYRPANKMRERLGWVPGVAHGPGSKPKGMHWKTYIRLFNRYHVQADRVMGVMRQGLDKMMANMHRINLKADQYE